MWYKWKGRTLTASSLISPIHAISVPIAHIVGVYAAVVWTLKLSRMARAPQFCHRLEDNDFDEFWVHPKYYIQIYCVLIRSCWILLGDTHDSQLHRIRPHSHCLCHSASCEGCSGGWNKWTDWRDTFQVPAQDIWIHRCCQSSRCARHSAMLQAHSVYWHRWTQSGSKCCLQKAKEELGLVALNAWLWRECY